MKFQNDQGDYCFTSGKKQVDINNFHFFYYFLLNEINKEDYESYY